MIFRKLVFTGALISVTAFAGYCQQSQEGQCGSTILFTKKVDLQQGVL